MKIAFIDIQNFRKLKSCRVELSENKTLFVGANNSGKTSAMDALIIFLKHTRQKDLSTTDSTRYYLRQEPSAVVSHAWELYEGAG
ncbi:MAG: ATP-binding protein [Desulfobulbaceae bacterium]|nr:ATP-binding protein [Desulfobulbaceae bacterium]